MSRHNGHRTFQSSPYLRMNRATERPIYNADILILMLSSSSTITTYCVIATGTFPTNMNTFVEKMNRMNDIHTSAILTFRSIGDKFNGQLTPQLFKFFCLPITKCPKSIKIIHRHSISQCNFVSRGKVSAPINSFFRTYHVYFSLYFKAIRFLQGSVCSTASCLSAHA